MKLLSLTPTIFCDGSRPLFFLTPPNKIQFKRIKLKINLKHVKKSFKIFNWLHPGTNLELEPWNLYRNREWVLQESNLALESIKLEIVNFLFLLFLFTFT